jgi:PrtD family type I secretion system ABC transporter
MRDFLISCRFYFSYAFFFSMFVNILQLTFPIYMLQVYDKVLANYNLSTLTVITVVAVAALVVLASLEWLRSRLLVRAGIEFDRVLSLPVLQENLKNATLPDGERKQGNLRDVQTLRNFLGGNAVFAFFDMPWMPLYIILVFILHPALGLVALCGAIIVFFFGVLNDRVNRNKLDTAGQLNANAGNFLNAAMRNAGIVRCMGMIDAVASRWEKINGMVIELQTRASHNAGLLHAVSRSFRVSLQVIIYCVGAYLAVTHVSTAGAMIAASIVMGRALAPIDLAMASYKQSQEARSAYKRLKAMLDSPLSDGDADLPAPAGALTVEDLVFTVKEHEIIKGISFHLPAGQSLAIIGPSAAGKSTICKLLLGIWRPTSGTSRIDDTEVSAWNSEALGPHIGYLPQDVELFTGSIAENIARLGDVQSDKVIFAAKLAGVHNLVLQLPKGYDTPIGEQGLVLSGGQRQRIGLARALYGTPKVVVLDEPNSNLDEEGEAGLVQALVNLKQVQSTVILVTHKPSVLSVVDNIMVLQEGQIVLSGPRQEVLTKLAAIRQQQEAAWREQEAERQRRAQEAETQRENTAEDATSNE